MWLFKSKVKKNEKFTFSVALAHISAQKPQVVVLTLLDSADCRLFPSSQTVLLVSTDLESVSFHQKYLLKGHLGGSLG